MCDEYREKPLGLAEAESVWYTHSRVVQEAMNNDPYTHGGVIDSMNKLGYINVQPFGVGPGKMILEKYFAYEEIKFLSCFRLQTATLPEVKRFMELISRFEKYLSENVQETTIGNTVPGYTPSYNGWNNPNLFGGASVQPLYGCPIPQNPVEEEVQKGPNEPDEQEEEMPSFLGSVWDNKPSPVRSALYNRAPGAPEPGFKNRTTKSKRVILSAEGISSKDDVQKGPNETEDETEKKQKEFTEMLYGSISDVPDPADPSGLKDRVSLKTILNYPSTGVKINENPVPLTEENKSVDKDDEKD